MIEPISLGFYEQNWYLIGFAGSRNEYRNFRVDRIKSICIEEELCQSHDGSLEQILNQILYKKLYALQCHCKNWGKGISDFISFSK